MKTKMKLFIRNRLITSMTVMSLVNLISPMIAYWSSPAFFTLRLILGLASVNIQWKTSCLIKCDRLTLGIGHANDPAALLPLECAGRAGDSHWLGFRGILTGQFHHFPAVWAPLPVWLRRWLAFHFLPIR